MSDLFRQQFVTYFDEFRNRITTESGDWTVKGFIDIYQRIYTITLDTKVLSKVLELLLFPVIAKFARENDYDLVSAREQNHYPDMSLVGIDGTYAVDIKSTYRTGLDRSAQMKVNGMTLGTFTGYFRKRDATANITFPYNAYKKHYVLGIVYTPVEGVDERQVYDIRQLSEIPSVAMDFEFFFHEKYQIAADRAGSGNTKNIGSTVYLERLLNGTGVFANLGVEVFDDYWMHYHTKGMAKDEGFEAQPYSNLLEYRRYKEIGTAILNVPKDQIVSEANEEDSTEE
jgi:Restriction endonuclease EcoRV